MKQEQEYTMKQEVTGSNEVPPDAITFEEAGIRLGTEKDVLSMRWNANELIKDLWKNLTGRIPKKINGVKYFIKTTSPLGKDYYIPDEGVKEIITLLNNTINPTTSLAHTTREEAMYFFAEFKRGVNQLFVCSTSFEGINVTRLENYENQLCLLAWHQLSKAIKGREARNAVTRINEQQGKQESTIREYLTGGKGMFKKDNPYEGGRA